MPERYDVVIIGARCAGAAAATYLARAGASVAMIDKSPLPSEAVLSTHTVHPSGMVVMDELGLGEAVRAHSPEMRTVRLDWHGGVLDLEMPRGQGEYCPRRKRFDGLLQDAARDAGVTVLPRTAARGLLRTGDRVSGVEVETATGERRSLYARLVIGADGRNSTVARWVKAEEYLGYDAPRGMYWGYFPAPAGWGKTTRYPAGMYVRREGQVVRVAFHSDDDQLLIGTLPLCSELAPFRADPLAALRAVIAQDDMLHHVVSAAPVEPVRGYLGERYFVRRAAGPGWLLLGDAGLYKDFLSGDGMSEALLQARAASHAIILALGADEAGGDLALSRFWRERDVHGVPLFFHAQDLGDPNSPAALNRAVFRGINARPELRARFASSFAREVSPFEVAPITTVLRCVAAAALRGEPSVIAQFVHRGRRVKQIMTDLELRRRLLAELPAAPDDRRLRFPVDSSGTIARSDRASCTRSTS